MVGLIKKKIKPILTIQTPLSLSGVPASHLSLILWISHKLPLEKSYRMLLMTTIIAAISLNAYSL